MKRPGKSGNIVPGCFYGITDFGRIRENNEDAFGIMEEQGLLVLADGLGGRNAGEIASRTAVEAVQEFFARLSGGLAGWLFHRPAAVKIARPAAGPEPWALGGMPRKMLKAIEYANSRIQQKSREAAEYAGMGTTLVMACLRNQWLHVASIGDSRAYIINPEGIRQLTSDHSIAWEMNDSGHLTAAEVRRHPLRNALTRDLNGSLQARPDISRHRVGPGDIVLLCSDGLWGMLDESRIQRTVMAFDSLEAAGRKLVERANIAGGRDNVTVVLMKIQ